MREEIYRLLSPPERGTPRYRAIAAVKEVSNWLLITLGIILVARACGAFNPPPGSAGAYLILALSVVFFARFANKPTVWLLRKLVGIGRKEVRDI